ncbi:hypothetical protein LQW54_004855 [Pestalotiopsis sp. IQ-011]
MKLVVGGSTGFVGTELVRQALDNPAITSIIGLGRRETPVPAGSQDGAGKLKSVVCDDFTAYPDSLKTELEGADACIWTIAVTPSKILQKTVLWEETVKVCRDYTVAALEAVSTASNKDGPLRFIYISGHFAPRAGDIVPETLTEFGLQDVARMRGQLETQILDFADQSNGNVQSLIAKSGMIHGPGMEVRSVPGLPNIELEEIAAALLDQVINGFEKDTLSNDDMVRIGKGALNKRPADR